MVVGSGRFVYEPIGQDPQPLQGRTPGTIRNNVGKLMLGVSLCALALFSAPARFQISPSTTVQLASPSAAESASPSAATSLGALPETDGGEVVSTSSLKLMTKVRVFTEMYQGATNTTHYAALVAEPHRESTLEVDVMWPAADTDTNIDSVEFR